MKKGRDGEKVKKQDGMSTIIVDTLVSTIGLTPKQNGRHHFPPH